MSIHSLDGITWSTKLERIGKLSMSHIDIVFNNLGHLINTDSLKEQYRQLDGNKAVGIDKMFSTKMENSINVLNLSKCMGILIYLGAGCGSSASPVLKRGWLK